MKVKKIIKKFCKEFGVKAKKGNCWEAFEDEVHYPAPKKYTSEGFMELIEKHYPDVKATEFTWSLLHEIGHTQTWGYFDNFEWLEYAMKSPEVYDIEEYYEIPQEKAATDWAYEFIKEYPEVVAKLEKKMRKALREKGYNLV